MTRLFQTFPASRALELNSVQGRACAESHQPEAPARDSASTTTLLAVIAALTLLCFGRSSFATCGDYLVHGMSASSEMEHVASPTLPPEPVPGRTCDGPHCGQLPWMPTSPAAPFEWSVPYDHAFVATAVHCHSAHEILSRRECDDHERAGHPEGIERPPRG